MAIDPSSFQRLNVADTCAVWNCLSSRRLYDAALAANCSFCCVAFVHYECLHKPRKNPTAKELELRGRFIAEVKNGRFPKYDISIDDLQEVAALEARRRLSKGELASIAFAKRTRQAFLTDDQKARDLASAALDKGMAQTTPHMLAWLFFESRLLDGDLEEIVSEHKSYGRPLEPHYRGAYQEALRCRLMASSPSGPTTSPDPASS